MAEVLCNSSQDAKKKRRWITLIECWCTCAAKDTSIKVRKHPQRRHTHTHMHTNPQSDTEQGCQLLQKHHWDNSDNKHSSSSQVFFSWGTLQWKFRANVPLYEHNNTSISLPGERAALESKRPNYRETLKLFAPEKLNDERKERIHPFECIWKLLLFFWEYVKLIIKIIFSWKKKVFAIITSKSYIWKKASVQFQ